MRPPKSKIYFDPEDMPYLIERHTFDDDGESFYKYVFKFPNRFGLSIVKNPYSSGYDKDLWTVYFIHHNMDPWCDYVPIRYPGTKNEAFYDQTSGQVKELLKEVKSWPFDKYKEM